MRTATLRFTLSLVPLLCAGVLAAQAPTATISGQVTDSIAQAPLAGAEVYVATGPNATAVGRGVRTGANGRYTDGKLR